MPPSHDNLARQRWIEVEGHNTMTTSWPYLYYPFITSYIHYFRVHKLNLSTTRNPKDRNNANSVFALQVCRSPSSTLLCVSACQIISTQFMTISLIHSYNLIMATPLYPLAVKHASRCSLQHLASCETLWFQTPQSSLPNSNADLIQ